MFNKFFYSEQKYCCLFLCLLTASQISIGAVTADSFSDGRYTATLRVDEPNNVRDYTLTTTAPLRDDMPADKTRRFQEHPDFPFIRTGSAMFDALYALSLDDARLNAVGQIRDSSFDVRDNMNRPYFQTGEKWAYIWTRDISYSVDLGLASLDPQRCINSLLFKTTQLKPGLPGVCRRQIVQDTGSGGSYPVSTDRVVWAIGASKLLSFLDRDQRAEFAQDAWQVMRDTIEHDRIVTFDTRDGLYRGEQSFLDWREQTYPGWMLDNVVAIAKSKALSTNIGHYQLLKTAAELSAQNGFRTESKKYARWADELRQAINKEFYLDSKGLYSSLILDEPVRIRLNRFDLLGQSLAILFGIADEEKSNKIINSYPQSQYGPPVVWPQEQTVPIYHNHAFWPFVTAYWLKAAKQAENSAGVDHAIYSIVRGTAFNLSNMENFDFITGNAWAEINGIKGPVINSRRQLWSVAGYMSMVQDVVFGLDTQSDGIRFLPCITSKLHRRFFNGSSNLVLDNFKFHDKKIKIIVNLPKTIQSEDVIYGIDKINLNDEFIKKGFISFDHLKKENVWQIWLAESQKKSADKINIIENTDRRSIFGPKQPLWKSVGQEGLTIEDGKLKLHYDANGETDVFFNIYRNGLLCAEKISATEWTDHNSGDFNERTYFYMIESIYSDSGNCSHLTPAAYYKGKENVINIGASTMQNNGGNLVNGNHFENWGRIEHTLQVPEFSVDKDGTYLISAKYSNGAGPINTGITCAVKKAEIADADSRTVAAYLVMPHTGDWQRYLDSSSFTAYLKAGQKYSFKIYEDNYARNMSSFDHYECYKGTGNGTGPYNYVNISNVRLLWLHR